MSEAATGNVREASILPAEELTEKEPLTTGELITSMLEIRDEKKRLEDRKKILNEQWRELEAEFIDQLEKQGAKRAGTDIGTATITENVLPTIVDWDALTAYVLETGSTHLFQRRVGAAAFRELREAGVDVPGVDAYIQKQISLRRRST